ncbi:MAG: amidase family protein [Actinomycetota bacterium]
MDLATANAIEIGAAIAAKELSSREALVHFVDRCEAVNDRVNAVVARDVERATQRAGEADDAAARGESWGPLHGVPMTLKDTWEFVGMTATAGAAEYRDHRPPQNADAVQRLVDAGAVVFAKTNTPPYAGDVQTYNELFGVTNNRWDPTRTAGGSSGGAAAALATGITPIELGSDIGGSIRTPSHYCGVVGHKPTHGIVSLRGHIPGPPGTLAMPDLAVGGPLARRASDLAAVLGIVAGPPESEPAGWHLELPAPTFNTLDGLRVGVWIDDPSFRVSSATKQIMGALADRLDDNGARVSTVTDVAGHQLGEMQERYLSLLAPIVGAGLSPVELRSIPAAAAFAAIQARRGKLPSRFVAGHLRGIIQRHLAWRRTDEQRQQLRHGFIEFFEDVDVLVTPVTPTAAPAHNNEGQLLYRTIDVDGETRSYMDQFGWIAPATLCGLPSTSVPAGIADGLPHNVQVIGAPFADRATIRVAELIEELDGPPARPPAFGA